MKLCSVHDRYLSKVTCIYSLKPCQEVMTAVYYIVRGQEAVRYRLGEDLYIEFCT